MSPLHKIANLLPHTIGIYLWTSLSRVVMMKGWLFMLVGLLGYIPDQMGPTSRD